MEVPDCLQNRVQSVGVSVAALSLPVPVNVPPGIVCLWVRVGIVVANTRNNGCGSQVPMAIGIHCATQQTRTIAQCRQDGVPFLSGELQDVTCSVSTSVHSPHSIVRSSVCCSS